MHYPDESYVRVYTRKTLTVRMLGWIGRCVRDAMLSGEEFDRAGVFEYVGDPAECISLVTEIPLDLVREGLRLLLQTKTWTLTDTAIVWPRYVEAQTCAKSDKTRASEYRQRRALTAARGNGATRPGSEPPSQIVTGRHEPSRNVTPSQGLCQPDLLFSDPDRASAQERELCEVEPEPEPRPPAPREHKRFPIGWKWSLKTTAAAVARGLTADDLQGHVDYYTTRAFPGGTVDDLDGEGLDLELRRSLPGIAERKKKASSAPPAAAEPVDRYAWAPTDEHRKFAKEHDPPLDLPRAVAAYRAAKLPERASSTLSANDDFMRRLRSWGDQGGDFPIGKLARPSKAVGA